MSVTNDIYQFTLRFGRLPLFQEEETAFFFSVNLPGTSSFLVCAKAKELTELSNLKNYYELIGADCGQIYDTKVTPFPKMYLHTVYLKNLYECFLAEAAVNNGEWREPKTLVPSLSELGRLLSASTTPTR